MVIHVVKKGDSLYSIGEQYGVDYKVVALENEIPLNTSLIVGQTIVLTMVDPKPKRGVIEVNGFAFPNISDEVLNKTLKYLTYLSIFSHQVSPNGDIAPLDDQHLIDKCISNKVIPMMVITNISPDGGFSGDIAHSILTNEIAQNNLINNTLTIMKNKNYQGLNVDFEYIPPEDKKAYNSFIAKITKVMETNGYSVSVDLAPKTSATQKGTLYEAHDYNFIGNTVEMVSLMTYEWGYTHSSPMAVAPIPQVKQVLDYAVFEMPSENILMGVPNYGYDWVIPYKQGAVAKTVGNYAAVDLARKYRATIEYDTKAQSPFFRYYDENKVQHEVWFEDARSTQAKLDLPFEYNLAGVSYWTINRFFPQNWLVLNSLYDIGKI